MAVTSIQPEPKEIFLEFGTRAIRLEICASEEDENLPGHIRVLTSATAALTRAVRIADNDDCHLSHAHVGLECLSSLIAQLAYVAAPPHTPEP